LEVQVSASLDVYSGLLTVWFVSIDPETDLPPDVLNGFLPPENGTGRGQGYISYTIQPKPDLPTGTEIRNIATIQFDFGEIIATNQVDPHDPTQGTDPTKEALITIDAGAPTSSVNPLPATETSTTLELTWQGADDNLGSGIKHYDVYISIDDGPFEVFLSGLTATAAIVPVETGRKYAFYSIATDNVGHVELPPATFDAEITIVSPLTLDAGPDQMAAEGALIALIGASFTFSGDLNSLSGTVNWGDGASEQLMIVPGAGGGTFANEHTYVDDGAYPIALFLTDGTGNAVEDTTSVTITNVAPDITLTGGAEVDEGSLFELTLGPVVDPGADTVSQYVIDWGDGDLDTIPSTDLPPDRTVTHTYANGLANYSIQVDLTDEDGTYANVAQHAITVNNVSPQITVSGAASVNEGSPFELTLGAVLDPGQDTITAYRIDWGDGEIDAIPAVQLPPDRKLTHTYADGLASYIVALDLTDEDGTYAGVAQHSVMVDNVPPQMSVSGAASVDEGSPSELTLGTVLDPGQDAITAYRIDWGDGQVDDIPAADLPPARNLSHTYVGGPGNYQIQVDLTDEDGTYQSVASHSVQVENLPSITGRVFIDSNANGLFEAGEQGIENVTIELLDEFGAPVLDAHGAAILAVTSAGGAYVFADLDPSTYQLHELQPAGFSDGPEYLGSLGGAVVANDTMQITLDRTDAFDYAFTEIGRQITAGQELAASLWLNLANTDDIGTHFDVLVEAVDQNDEVFASGMLDRFRPVRSPSAPESLVLTAFRSVTFDPGDSFSLRIKIRIDEGPGHTSGRLQLKYDAASRSSSVSVDFGQGPSTYYLHTNSQMDTTNNTGDNTIDIITKLASKQNGNPWVEMGTWIGTVE
jgi:hypothetical protein